MEAGEKLSLKQAAQLAGVSEVTMRNWVKDVPNVQRNLNGGYEIPRQDLMGYLAGKDGRKFAGAKASRGEPSGGSSGETSALEVMRELVEELRGEREGLKQELTFARQSLREAEARNRELQNDLTSITRELKELIFGGGKPGLSAWMTKVQPDQDTGTQDAIVVEKTKPSPKAATVPQQRASAKTKPSKGKGKPTSTSKVKAKPKKKR